MDPSNDRSCWGTWPKLVMSKKATPSLKAIDERALIMVPSWDQAILGSIRGLTDEQKRRVEEKLSPVCSLYIGRCMLLLLLSCYCECYDIREGASRTESSRSAVDYGNSFRTTAQGQWSCRTTTAGCGSTSEVVCYTSCRTSSPAEEQCSSLAEDVGYSSCRTSSVAEEQCSSRTRTAGRGSTKVVDYSSCRTSSTSEGQCCGRTRTAGCGSTAEAEPEQLAPVAPPTAAPVPVQPPKASAQAEPEQLAPPESSTAAPVPVQPPKAKALAEPEQLAPLAPPPKSSLPKPRPLGLPSATVLASSVIVLLSWLSKVLYSGKDEDWFDNKDLAGPRCQELILYEPWERMVQGSDSKWVFGADCLADDLESFCQCVSENVPGIPSWRRCLATCLSTVRLTRRKMISLPRLRTRSNVRTRCPWPRGQTVSFPRLRSQDPVFFSMLHQDGKNTHTHIYIHLLYSSN